MSNDNGGNSIIEGSQEIANATRNEYIEASPIDEQYDAPQEISASGGREPDREIEREPEWIPDEPAPEPEPDSEDADPIASD